MASSRVADGTLAQAGHLVEKTPVSKATSDLGGILDELLGI